MLTVTLKEYLTSLEAAEGQKPPGQRRDIPSIADLAEAVGVSRATLYNIAGNYVDGLSRTTLSKVMSELRRRGFDVQVSDLIKAYPVAA